jgi:hypothetical protein
MTDLALYGGFSITEYPQPEHIENPGQTLGVYISVAPAALHTISERIARWFHGRDEVDVVDVGVSDKQGLGYILMEWDGFDIDPLFLAILRDEEAVVDYTVYARDVEVL